MFLTFVFCRAEPIQCILHAFFAETTGNEIEIAEPVTSCCRLQPDLARFNVFCMHCFAKSSDNEVEIAQPVGSCIRLQPPTIDEW